jgi:hypothetical protein
MNIEFSILENYADLPFHPAPANNFYPDWFKSLPATTPQGISTLKRCPPMVDMFSMGYIVPAWCEFTLTPDFRGQYNIDSRMPVLHLPFEGDRPLVQGQNPQQYVGTPWEGQTVIKIHSPWIVKTPPGYSLMLLPLFGKHNQGLEPISAILESDNYNVTLSIFCRITAKPGEQIHVKPGDPLVQLIPYKRDTWHSKYTIKKLIDHARIANKLKTYITSGYRRFWHKKKEFN